MGDVNVTQAAQANQNLEAMPWPDPTAEMLESPMFEAIWQAIKTWDINVPGAYGGYMGATGNHVRHILTAITRAPEPATQQPRADVVEALRNAIIRAGGDDCTTDEAEHYAQTMVRCGLSLALRTQAPASDEVKARPLEEWHEDMGDVVWWKFPVTEPAMIGNPLDSAWPGYHTHWTPHPPIPSIDAALGAKP